MDEEDHNIGDTDPYSMDTNAQLEYMNGQYGGGGVPDPSVDDSSSSYDPTDTSAEDAQNGYVDPSAGSPVQYAGGYAPQPQGAFIPQDAPDSLGKGDLLRLGLNWMAAAGKPGATALGSFGEAGSSVLKDKDTSAKEFAKQQRLAYYKAQEQTIARQKLAQGLQIAQGRLAEDHDYHGQEIGIRQGELGIAGGNLGVAQQRANTEADRAKAYETNLTQGTEDQKNYNFEVSQGVSPEQALKDVYQRHGARSGEMNFHDAITTVNADTNSFDLTPEQKVAAAHKLLAASHPTPSAPTGTPSAAGAGLITVKNSEGKSFQINPSDLQDAANDGYKQVQ